MRHRKYGVMVLSIALGLAATSFATPSAAWAQVERGSVLGKVADSTGAIVPNAAVTLTNDETGVTVSTKTNATGEYSFQDLNPGRYSLTTVVPGFEKYVKEHMQVDVGGRVETDVALIPGKQDTTVTVEGGYQQLSYASASLGLVVEQKAITDLPLIYGNPFALEVLAAGVTLSGVNPNIHVYDSGSATVSVNGSALNALDYKLDGGPDNRIRYSAYTPSTEFISQYKLNTANYDASEGHSSGGFVNTQLKSGTNRIHGSAFVYYQNPKINATPWTLPSATPAAKPTFVREGGGIGGPFWRDKAFWFGGFEHSRQSAPNPMSLTVPTVPERTGDFSALYALDTNTGTGGSASNICTAGGTLVTPTGTPNKYQLFYPNSATGTSATNYNRACIPGNKIPANLFSPIATALMQYYPLPNNTANQAADGENNFSYGANEPDLYNAEVGRVDFTLTPRQSLYSHLVWSSRTQANKNNYFPPVSGTTLYYKNRGAVFGYTFVLSPTTVLNAVAAYTRFTNANVPGDQGVVGPTTIGMPSYLTAGLPITADSLPSITPTLYAAATTASGTQAADDIWLGSVDLSRQVSTHLLRFGTEYRRYITNGMSGSGEQGSYTSTGNLAAPTNTSTLASAIGFSLAELELGYLTSGSETENSDFSVRTQYFAGYFQDDWRATSKLTVNMGLRWEYETPDIERNGKQIVQFNFAASNSTTTAAAAAYVASKIAATNALLPATISPTGGAVFANTDGFGLNPYTSPKTDFLPRIGFAFAANPKTVIRGGFGIFFDSLNSYYLSGGNAGSTTTFLVPQQGYSAVSNVAAPTFTTATGLVFTSTLANPFPGGLTPITGNSLGTSTALGQNIQFLQPNPHVPYNERYSFGFQRQLGQWVAALDYVGNHGVHQPTGQISQGTNTGGQEYNNYPVSAYSKINNGYDQTNNLAETLTVTNPFYGLIPSGAVNNLATNKVTVSQLQRPYPEYASINAFGTNGMSIYNSLQAQLQRRFSNGLSATVAYTWSRTLDAITYLNPVDPRPWYGVSANDRPQRLAISSIYQFPFGHGRRWLSSSHGIVAQIVGGWQAQGVYQIQSGAPLTFTGNDLYYGTNPGDSHWTRADYKASVGKVPNSASFGRGNWFNTANWVNNGTGTTNPILTCANTTVAFCPGVLPGTYQLRTFGLRYNTLRADNLNQADVGVQRQFQMWELGTLQFRAEAINVLNHPVYSAPSTTVTAAAFAEIVSQANQPRVYQFSGFFRF